MELLEVIKDAASVCIVIASLAGGVAVIFKVLNYYASQKEFRKKCEAYEERITDVDSKVSSAHDFAQESLTQMQSDTDAKLQEIRAEQEMITMCMRAVLDGLHQLHCNGEVTEASKRLDDYLNAKAHS